MHVFLSDGTRWLMGKKERQRKARQAEAATAGPSEEEPAPVQLIDANGELSHDRWCEAECAKISSEISKWIKQGDALDATKEEPSNRAPKWMEFMGRKLELGRAHLGYLQDVLDLKRKNLKTKKPRDPKGIIKDYMSLHLQELERVVEERKEMQEVFEYMQYVLVQEIQHRDNDVKMRYPAYEWVFKGLICFSDAIFESIWFRNCVDVQRGCSPFFEILRSPERKTEEQQATRFLHNFMKQLCAKAAPARVLSQFLETLSEQPMSSSALKNLRQPITAAELTRLQTMLDAIVRYETLCVQTEKNAKCRKTEEMMMYLNRVKAQMESIHNMSIEKDSMMMEEVEPLP